MDKNEPFTIEKLKEAMKLVEKKPIDFKPINDFVSAGGSMDNVHLVTSHPQFKNIKSILTTRGIVKVQYSPFVADGEWYIMNPPKTEDWWKPNFRW